MKHLRTLPPPDGLPPDDRLAQLVRLGLEIAAREDTLLAEMAAAHERGDRDEVFRLAGELAAGGAGRYVDGNESPRAA
jgi:hypothetical protein